MKNEVKFEKSKESPEKIEKEIKKMEMQKNMVNRKKKKHKIITITILLVVIVFLLFSTIFAFLNINNEKIINGISIKGIDVSGLSREEASNKIKKVYEEKQTTDIPIYHNEYESSISPELLEVNYDIDNAINNAYSIGKSGNIFVNNFNILKTMICKKNIDVDMTINEDVEKRIIQDINVNMPDSLVESSYSVDDDKLTITKGKSGVVVNEKEFTNKIKERLININISNSKKIEIPVINKDPQPIDIDKIYNEIHKDSRDAYYTENPFTVYPEVNGVSFDLEKARELLQENQNQYIINLTITKPNVTLDKIDPKAFRNQLSTFSTRYDVSDKDRSTNLELACKKIDGIVVLSGETFSYNKIVGARTSGAGYKNAKIYQAGKVVDGVGGGICQISSTLYNAVLNANMEIVERKNHQFITSYVEPGLDATVVYGVTDFKFKNTRKYPIRISATAKNGIASITIYGIKEEEEYTFTFDVKKVAVIPYKTQYINDSTLPAGTEVVEQKGVDGVKTETYMTKLLNGKAISTTLLSKDTYSAMTKIVRKGTKN